MNDMNKFARSVHVTSGPDGPKQTLMLDTTFPIIEVLKEFPRIINDVPESGVQYIKIICLTAIIENCLRRMLHQHIAAQTLPEEDLFEEASKINKVSGLKAYNQIFKRIIGSSLSDISSSYQIISKLFQARNAIAHGNSVELSGNYGDQLNDFSNGFFLDSIRNTEALIEVENIENLGKSITPFLIGC